ncbi:MAG TPA: PEP-CTERM sorting domain-containing protein [Rhizomicrobium sp.]|nr:PEP-CTERM sorting domain-containing protein [Rhizomicrobium sp.]
MVFHKMMKRGLLAALAAMAIGSAAHAAPILPPGFSGVTLDFTISPGFNPITNMVVFDKSTTGDGYGRSSLSTAHTGFNEFSVFIPPPPCCGLAVSGFGAGVIAGLPGDPVGPVINHLVVFGNFSPAQLALDYTALFPSISESTWVNDLLTTPFGTSYPTADFFAFIGDAKKDGIYGVNGTPISAVAFSTGTVIGTGSVIITRPAAVPEPMSLALFGTGLAGVAALRRRKRQTA